MKTCCDPSLEPFQQEQGSSNGRSQHMFLWRNIENHPYFHVIPSFQEEWFRQYICSDFYIEKS